MYSFEEQRVGLACSAERVGGTHRRRHPGRDHRAQRVHIRGGVRRAAFRHVTVRAHGGGAYLYLSATPPVPDSRLRPQLKSEMPNAMKVTANSTVCGLHPG